MADTTSH